MKIGCLTKTEMRTHYSVNSEERDYVSGEYSKVSLWPVQEIKTRQTITHTHTNTEEYKED